MMKFMINNRTDMWKTDVNLLNITYITSGYIVRSTASWKWVALWLTYQFSLVISWTNLAANTSSWFLQECQTAFLLLLYSYISIKWRGIQDELKPQTNITICLYKESCCVWLVVIWFWYFLDARLTGIKANQQHWMVPCRAMPTFWMCQIKCQISIE